MQNTLIAAWNWLSGKKTLIGAVAANLLPWTVLMGWMSDAAAMRLMILVNALTGVSLASNAWKALAARRALKYPT